MNPDDDFHLLIERGDAAGVRDALAADPALAHRPIRWRLDQDNVSDPLHYVSDCVGNGWLTNGAEGEIAEALLRAGAAIDGSDGRESPLIAAASLGAEEVARVLVDAGAALEKTSLHGARALHWAAWVGSAATVSLLVEHGAEIEARCADFAATPLFWAVHGYAPDGPNPKRGQVEAARVLIAAGAAIGTANRWDPSAIDLARSCAQPDMAALLEKSHHEGSRED
jgi:ankyrin repeat protein